MSPQFYRLIWKEWRAQRALWFSLLAVSTGIVVTIILLSGEDLTGSTLGLATVVSVAFACGAGATAFSGEVEEGTAFWPRMLPMKTRTLVGAKLTTTFAGMITLLLASAAVNLLLCFLYESARQLLFQRPFRMTSVSLELSVAGNSAWMLLSCVLVTTLCSIQSRTVMMAVGCAAILLALPFPVAVYLDNRNVDATNMFTATGVIACIVGLFIPTAARRWRLGRPGVFTQISAIKPNSRAFRVLQEDWGLFWQRSLEWCVRRPTQNHRTTAVLLWRELRFATVYAITFSELGLLVAVVRATLGRGFELIWFLIGVAVMEAGLRTFRHDQQQDRRMFLSHRGISPALTWLLRTVVWFGMLVFVTIILLAIEHILLLTIPPRFPVRSVVQGMQDLIRSRHEVSSLVTLQAAMVMFTGGFLISQLSAFWTRSPLVATFCAIVGAGAFSAWTGYVRDYNVPISVFVCPILIYVAVAGFVTRRQWMERDADWKTHLRRLIPLTVACLSLWPLSVLWQWAHSVFGG